MGNDAQGDEADIRQQIDDLATRVAANRADIDALGARADAANDRAEEMEAREQLDREMISELQADGVLSQQHAEQMEQALRSSRTIGMAIGIIMASRKVSDDEAFAILRAASQKSNLKLRNIADEVVRDSGTHGLP